MRWSLSVLESLLNLVFVAHIETSFESELVLTLRYLEPLGLPPLRPQRGVNVLLDLHILQVLSKTRAWSTKSFNVVGAGETPNIF